MKSWTVHGLLHQPGSPGMRLDIDDADVTRKLCSRPWHDDGTWSVIRMESFLSKS